jgi:hypothetical protein
VGWTGMGFPRIVSDLDSHLKWGEKKREVLYNLLISGRISQNTFDSIEKKISRVTSIVSDLKASLEKEESFWNGSLSEETGILESLLIDLELRRLLGEIGEEEWTQKSKIINLGLDSLKNNGTLTSKIEQKPAPPIQTTLEEHASKKIVTQVEDRRDPSEALAKIDIDVKHINKEDTLSVKHPLDRRKRLFTKELPEIERSMASKVHCMNPWKRECKNTDIKLSIYYHGRMTPICRSCWEDISEKNIEWTSL